MAAYENPLMPNAKLRQIYLAILQARLVTNRLGKSAKASIALEACLVSPSVDLGPADLVSDASPGKTTAFLRGTAAGTVLGKPHAGRGLVADCGKGSLLPAIEGVRERLWASIGAAQALRAAFLSGRTTEGEATGQGVMVTYLQPGEAPKPLLREVFACASKQELPVIFVLMPSREPVNLSSLSLKAGVPGIAVDGADAVAIYRVAQESIGRARAGGGPALIECVPFVLAGSKKPQASDALTSLEAYLLQRRVCTRAWMDRAAASSAKRLA